MKKIISSLISFFLALGITVPFGLNAQALEDSYKILSATDNTVTIQFYDDNVIYDFIREEQTITVVNHLSKDIVFVSQVEYYDMLDEVVFSQNPFDLNLTAEDYENWNTTWSVYRRGHIQLPSSDADTATSIIAGLLLSGCGILGLTASTVISIATGFRDRSLDNAYFIQYYRTNLNCGILAKTYATYYTTSSYNISLGSSPEGYMWTDTPWDYSTPAACRVLVNSYPA